MSASALATSLGFEAVALASEQDAAALAAADPGPHFGDRLLGRQHRLAHIALTRRRRADPIEIGDALLELCEGAAHRR